MINIQPYLDESARLLERTGAGVPITAAACEDTFGNADIPPDTVCGIELEFEGESARVTYHAQLQLFRSSIYELPEVARSVSRAQIVISNLYMTHGTEDNQGEVSLLLSIDKDMHTGQLEVYSENVRYQSADDPQSQTFMEQVVGLYGLAANEVFVDRREHIFSIDYTQDRLNRVVLGLRQMDKLLRVKKTHI